MTEHGNTVERFATSCIEVTGDADDVVHKGDLYTMFTRFADFMGRDPEVQQTFTKQLKEIGGVGDGRSRRVTGEVDRPHVFEGIRVIPSAVEKIQAEHPRHAYSDGDSGGGDQQSL